MEPSKGWKYSRRSASTIEWLFREEKMFNAFVSVWHRGADTRIRIIAAWHTRHTHTHTKNYRTEWKKGRERENEWKTMLAACSGNKFKLDMFFCSFLLLFSALYIISIRIKRNISAKSKATHSIGSIPKNNTLHARHKSGWIEMSRTELNHTLKCMCTLHEKPSLRHHHTVIPSWFKEQIKSHFGEKVSNKNVRFCEGNVITLVLDWM